MLTDQRHLFELPAGGAYFNAAYMGPFLKSATEAGAAALAMRARPWTTGAEDFFTTSERLRETAGRLFGASGESMALVPSASYGLATAAKNLLLGKGQEILILDGQFPSNVFIWRRLAAERKATLRVVSRPPGESWTEAVLGAIRKRTAIAALPHVHWVDGGRLDLEAIGERARKKGAALVLDLTQSLGALPFDAAAVDPDFAVAAGYKWLLGPYTTGFLYAAERHWAGAPLEENWIVRKGAEDFAGLTNYSDGYADGARRYDMGERSNFQLLPIAEAALDQILDWTPEAVAETLGAMNERLAARLNEIGLETEGAPDRAGHYLTAGLPDNAPEDLLARLKAEGVFISQRGPRLRITGHLNIDEGDQDRLVNALRKHLA